MQKGDFSCNDTFEKPFPQRRSCAKGNAHAKDESLTECVAACAATCSGADEAASRAAVKMKKPRTKYIFSRYLRVASSLIALTSTGEIERERGEGGFRADAYCLPRQKLRSMPTKVKSIILGCARKSGSSPAPPFRQISRRKGVKS